MIVIKPNYKIELVSGDSFSLEIEIDCYTLVDNEDYIYLKIYKGSQTKLEKQPIDFINGKAYFHFTSEETRSLGIGTFNYDLIFKKPNTPINQTILNNREITLLEGVNYGL